MKQCPAQHNGLTKLQIIKKGSGVCFFLKAAAAKRNCFSLFDLGEYILQCRFGICLRHLLTDHPKRILGRSGGPLLFVGILRIKFQADRLCLDKAHFGKDRLHFHPPVLKTNSNIVDGIVLFPPLFEFLDDQRFVLGGDFV